MSAADELDAGAADVPSRPAPAVSRSRRVLDVLVALGAGIVLAPVVVAAAVAVLISDGWPVLFRQERIGEGGRRFTILKLRTMRTSDRRGPEVTGGGDPRVTRVGRFLRASSLDELPQLLNVLRGEMTLVGPRPETPDLARRYPPACHWVLQHRPGLTGPAQVGLRDAHVLDASADDPERVYLETLVPRRVTLDESYLAAPTMRATLRVLRLTALHLVRPSATTAEAPDQGWSSYAPRSS